MKKFIAAALCTVLLLTDAAPAAWATAPADGGAGTAVTAEAPCERTLTDASVTVTGVLPAGTELAAEQIDDPFTAAQPARAKAAKRQTLGGEAADGGWKAAAFYDVKLIRGGETLQPDQAVTVTIENVPLSGNGTVSVKHFLDSEAAIAAAMADGSAEAVEDAVYVRAFPAEAAAAEAATGRTGVVFVETVTEADGLTVDGGTVTFPAKSFSIYAVGEEEDNYRIEVRFHPLGTDPVSFIVKPRDAEHLSEFVYDPGPGAVAAGVVFRGWTTQQPVPADVTPMDFEAALDLIREKLDAITAETYGTAVELDFYPVTFNGHYVYFKDENGAVITIEAAADGAVLPVSRSYSPLDTGAEFVGWKKADDDAVPPTLYDTAHPLTVTEDVTLVPHLTYGWWLVFDENDGGSGGGASYIGPRIVEDGNQALTRKPDDPTRPGYTFGGWYNEPACTSVFDWSTVPSNDNWNADPQNPKTRTIYAKWDPKADTDYTVVVWQQKVSDDKNAVNKTYEFYHSYPLTAPTETEITDELIAEYVNLAFKEKAITGTVYNTQFRYSHREIVNGVGAEGDRIAGRGNTVVNVYYDRALYTIYFMNYGNGTVYVPTDATTGTLYGLVDGEYVLLSKTETNKQIKWTWNETASGTGRSVVKGKLYTGRIYSTKNNDPQLVPAATLETLVNGSIGSTFTSVSINGSTRYLKGKYNSDYYKIIGKVIGDIAYSYQGEPYTGQFYEAKTGTVFTGLYGQPFSMYGYTWPDPPSGRWDQISFLDSFTGNLFGATLLGGQPNYIETKSVSLSSDKELTLKYYKEVLDGETYDAATAVTYNGTTYALAATSLYEVANGSFNLTNRFEGFQVFAYSTDKGVTWHEVESEGYINNVQSGNGRELHILNKRFRQDIIFMLDGVELADANGNAHSDDDYGPKDIPFGKPIAEYEAYLPMDASIVEGLSGSYFDKWYQDGTKTVPLGDDFWEQTMPSNNVTLYASVRPMRYRVVLELDGGYLSGGTGAETFRVNNGAAPEIAPVSKDGYVLLGWYTDPSLSAESAFNVNTRLYPDTPGMNTDYYGTDLWHTVWQLDHNDPGRTQRDDDGEHEDVRGILYLYAKWRKVLDADGVGVEYVDGSGSVLSTDGALYQDHANAFAAAAPAAPEGQEFKYWIVMDGSGEGYAETDEHVFAGDLFEIRADYAKESGEAPNKTYTVRLMAEFGPSGAGATTSITYDGNFEGSVPVVVDGLQINADYTVADNPFTRPGYRFLHWSTAADDSGTSYAPGATVALDILAPAGNVLYAVWQEATAVITYTAVGPDGSGSVSPASETIPAVTGTAAGSTATVNDGFRFLGWFDNAACTGEPLTTNETYVPVRSGDAWTDAAYYARFEYDTTTLTVTNATGHHAIFTVTGKGYAGADALRVGIPAGESVTVANVYVGETYTVSEEGAWSWRFTAQECGSGGLSAGVNVCSVPAAQPVRTLWLSGCDADRKSKPALTIEQ